MTSRPNGLLYVGVTDNLPRHAWEHRDGFAFIHLYTHEKMTENQAMYAKLGYVEFDRRTEHGFARVYMRKALR